MTAVHRLVEMRADATPDAIAVDGPGRRISYLELDRAANHVAHSLLAVGGSADRLAVLLGDPSPEWLAGLLGIWKAGCAYLPIDPNDRSERVPEILRQADPIAIVTAQPWHEQAMEYGLSIHIVGPAQFSVPVGRPEIGVADSALAYVMFTSGSTGHPKGVLVEHRSLANYCAWIARVNRVNGQVAPLPALTKPVFDASMQQLVAPLTRGDTVWLAQPGLASDPEGVLHFLKSRPGFGLHCVPALWAELLDLIDSGSWPAVRLASLFLGGDRVSEQLWARTREVLGDTAVANVYGPTETTVQATGGFLARGEPLSVGRPADGAVVMARRPDGAVASPGEQGELWIGGAGVARGYLGLPELTAECFLLGGDVPGRVYRTGDAGTIDADGRVHVAGRLDHQIKLRGLRIEPAEVEAALALHPDVASVTVVATDALEAAVTVIRGRPAEASLVEDLRELAARRLPAYMTPAHIHLVDRMPVTANGKVDRRGVVELLRSRRESRLCAARDERASFSETEQLVASVWQDVIGTEVTERSANFFELGGHSLLANKAAARLRRATGVAGALRMIFEQRTVKAVADAIDAAGVRVARTGQQSQGQPSADLIQVDRAPLSFQQAAVWSIEKALAGTPFNHMLIPIEITGQVDQGAVAGALADLVDAQPALRTRYLSGDEGTVQIVDPSVPLRFGVQDLRGEDESSSFARARAKVRELYLEPFDLAAGPAWRAELLRVADEVWLLPICVHHIACDGMSIQIIIDALADSYRMRLEGSPTAPSAVAGYAAYALSQQADAKAGRLAESLAYWRAKLDRARTPLVTRAQGQFRYGSVSTELGAIVCRDFRRRAAAEGVTVFMVLVAATAAWFASRADVEFVRLGMLAANRTLPDFDNTVGLFATTVVLDIAVAPGADIDDLAQVARTEIVDTFAHQGVPLELVCPDEMSPFEVGLTWETPRQIRAAGGSRFGVYEPRGQSDRLAMHPSTAAVSITASGTAERIVLTCEFNESAMSRGDAQLLLEGLCRQLRDFSRPQSGIAKQEADR